MKADEIIQLLDNAEKIELLKLYNIQHPINERFRFIKQVINDRLNLNIYGWDLLDYNLIFQTICNRIYYLRDQVVHIAYNFVEVLIVFK